MNFDEALAFVLLHEGESSNDPDDTGGLTKFGISSKAHPEVYQSSFDKADALAIYESDYWKQCKCAQFHPAIGFMLFDCAVNQGPNAAVRMLQRSLNVKADGIIGPITLAAAASQPVDATLSEFAARRAVAYAAHPMIGAYGLGWFRRLSAAHQLALKSL